MYRQICVWRQFELAAIVKEASVSSTIGASPPGFLFARLSAFRRRCSGGVSLQVFLIRLSVLRLETTCLSIGLRSDAGGFCCLLVFLSFLAQISWLLDSGRLGEFFSGSDSSDWVS